MSSSTAELEWNQIETILDNLLEFPAPERRSYLHEKYKDQEKLCNEVLSILDGIEKSNGYLAKEDGLKDDLFMNLALKSREYIKPDSFNGKIIGNYRIRKQIGHGGMGTVYLANRNDKLYNQQVALKLIRHGMDTPDNISRFKRERYILSALNHPNIARLYDGGVTNHGLPYLVMEYVDGIPIDEYCDKNKLSVKERIELFKIVCSTVQYAHNNMVIHRDLKPANILVDNNGDVKILDFGIAKLIEPGIQKNFIETRTHQNIMTPGYAAPEQILGNTITTATDSYTLGVVLHKLLTGTTPYNLEDLNFVETQNVIVNQSLKVPSRRYLSLPENNRISIAKKRKTTSARLVDYLKKDLDIILLKSLRKENEFRYEVVKNFLDDLERYQQNLPVKAREGNLTYHFGKLLRRRKKLITALAAMILLTFSFGAYHSSKMAFERYQAQTEAKKANQVTTLLLDLFKASNPDETLGDDITARQLLDRGLSKADILAEQPEVQAQLFSIIGQIFHQLGNYEESGPLLNKALTIQKNTFGNNHPETAASLGQLGKLKGSLGEYEEAEQLLRESLHIFNSNHISDTPLLAEVQSNLAFVVRRRGDYQQAEELYKNVIEILHGNYGPDYIQTINMQNRLATTLFNQGMYNETETIYREVLEKRRNLLGDIHPSLAESMNSLGALLMNLGRFQEAEELLNKALDIRLQTLGPNHPKVALTYNNLGIVYRDQGLFGDSKTHFDKAISIRSRFAEQNRVSLAISQFSLAELMLMKNQPDSAIVYFNDALPVFRDVLSEDHSFTARTRMNIGYSYLLKNEIEKAESYLTSGFRKVIKVHEPATMERAFADHQLGNLHIVKGRYSLADSLISQAVFTLQNLEESISIKQQIMIEDIEKLRVIRNADYQNNNLSQSDTVEKSP